MTLNWTYAVMRGPTGKPGGKTARVRNRRRRPKAGSVVRPTGWSENRVQQVGQSRVGRGGTRWPTISQNLLHSLRMLWMEGSATVNIGRVAPSAEPEIGVASQGAAFQDKQWGKRHFQIKNKYSPTPINRSVDLWSQRTGSHKGADRLADRKKATILWGSRRLTP